MRFDLKKSPGNIYNIFRELGYRVVNDEKGKWELIRILGLDGYPRFHLFLNIDEEGGKITLDLHLDQKKPIYKNAPAHSGEYDGEVVEKEMERIKKLFEGL